MSSLVNFIVGGMLGYLVVRKMANTHTISSEPIDNQPHLADHHNGHTVSYAKS